MDKQDIRHPDVAFIDEWTSRRVIPPGHEAAYRIGYAKAVHDLLFAFEHLDTKVKAVLKSDYEDHINEWAKATGSHTEPPQAESPISAEELENLITSGERDPDALEPGEVMAFSFDEDGDVIAYGPNADFPSSLWLMSDEKRNEWAVSPDDPPGTGWLRHRWTGSEWQLFDGEVPRHWIPVKKNDRVSQWVAVDGSSS
jgi:hypothetical protein